MAHEVQVLHSLIERFALQGGFGRDRGGMADELGHGLVDAVGLPVFPAYFEVGVFAAIGEGEQVVLFDVFWEELVIGVVDSEFAGFVLHLFDFFADGGGRVQDVLGFSL